MRRPRGRGEQGRLRSGPTRGPASSHDTHPGRGRPDRVAPSGQPPRPSGASTAAARTARGGRHPALTAGQAPDAPPDAGPEAGSQLAGSNSTPGREPRTLLGEPHGPVSPDQHLGNGADLPPRERHLDAAGDPVAKDKSPGAPARIAPVRIVDDLPVAAGQAERQVDVPASPGRWAVHLSVRDDPPQARPAAAGLSGEACLDPPDVSLGSAPGRSTWSRCLRNTGSPSRSGRRWSRSTGWHEEPEDVQRPLSLRYPASRRFRSSRFESLAHPDADRPPAVAQGDHHGSYGRPSATSAPGIGTTIRWRPS